MTSTVEVSIKTSPSPRSAPTPKAEEEPAVEPAVPEPVVTVSAEGSGPGTGENATGSTSSVVGSQEEEPAPPSVSNVPKTFANLFKGPQSVNNKPATTQPPANKVTTTGNSAAKGPNGPRAGSPGNSQFVSQLLILISDIML